MSLNDNALLTRISFAARAVGGYALLGNALAVCATVWALVAPTSVWVAPALWLALAWALGEPVLDAYRSRRGLPDGDELQLGKTGLPRIVVALGALAIATAGGATAATVVTGIGVCLLILAEQSMRRPVRSATPQVANLPGWEVTPPSTALSNAFFWLNTGATVLLLIAATSGLPPALGLLCALPGIGIAAVLSAQALRFLTGRNRWEKNLLKVLRELGPVFAFHWQAPVGTAYQAAMWLPYLAKLGVPYFVLVRTPGNFEEVAKLTDAPVILRVALEDLDPIVCPSLKVVFYVNTAVRNSHMIRFPQLTHIQLNHGDSDKIASVSPTFRQYDRNFVAGQAAIDRFAKHGVETREDSFEIVGRPQLEAVKLAVGPISGIAAPTVLYSPTWSGFYDDSDYSSLPAGPQIVAGLLERGCTVVFRPHPYSRRHQGNAEACDAIIELLGQDAARTGRQHVFGATAETGWSIVDCFNASDAMISDVSSVVSDYLISRKPFAMGAVSAHGEAFLDEFPLGAAAYVFDVRGGRAESLDEVLDNLLGADPKAAERDRLRTYYLGGVGPDDCVEHFVSKARSYLV